MATHLEEFSQIIFALGENEIEYAANGKLGNHGFAKARYGIDILIRVVSLIEMKEVSGKLQDLVVIDRIENEES